jgi:hypothetical protein
LHLSKKIYESAPIEVAHEECSSTLHSVLGIYLSGQLGKSVKSIVFTRLSECVPLQTADLVSYERYRYWQRIQSGVPKAIITDRPQMSKLEEIGHWALSGHYDGDALKILIKRHHSINRLYDPFPEV